MIHTIREFELDHRDVKFLCKKRQQNVKFHRFSAMQKCAMSTLNSGNLTAE